MSNNYPTVSGTIARESYAIDIPEDIELDDQLADHRMWAIADQDHYPCDKAISELVPGQYTIRYSDRGIYFTKKIVNLDELIPLPDNNTEKVLESIGEFWSREESFRELKFLWKRGILLWGPPGGGKTSAVQQLSKQVVDDGGISIISNAPTVDAQGLEVLRRIEPHRRIVVIIEDIDAVIEQHGEADLLALLDGENQVDNVVFVATTNYPERLDKRFVNRPSRFDEIIKIDMPNSACRREYLSVKNPRLKVDTVELDSWVERTKGFSIAHLKELIVSVECFNKDPDDVINRLVMMMEKTISSSQLKEEFGFGKK